MSIRRYFAALAAGFYSVFVSDTVTAFTDSTVTYDTVLKGPPGANLTLKVTTYAAASMSAVYKINGTTHVLNDTVVVTLDSAGNLTITQFLDVGSMTVGDGLNIVLTLISVDIGLIGGSNFSHNSKIV